MLSDQHRFDAYYGSSGELAHYNDLRWIFCVFDLLWCVFGL